MTIKDKARPSGASLVNSDEALQRAGELVPYPKVATEFHVTLQTLDRWDADEKLATKGWQPPVKIRGRKYQPRQTLERFKENLIREATGEQRGGKAA